jgi:hypothetical protein
MATVYHAGCPCQKPCEHKPPCCKPCQRPCERKPPCPKPYEKPCPPKPCEKPPPCPKPCIKPCDLPKPCPKPCDPCAQQKVCALTGGPHCRCKHKVEPIAPSSPKDTMRILFTDHAVYTKFVIDALLTGSGEADALIPRLLENQKEIGHFIGLYSGEEYGMKIGELFTEHIKRAAAVMMAVRNGTDTTRPTSLLFENILHVSQCLSSIPGSTLKYEHVCDAFYLHNVQVVGLINAHSQRKWHEEVELYDQYFCHIIYFSDMLSKGLIYK